MGRNAKPIALHIAQGNPNRLTKAEIEARKKSEIKLGEQKFKCPQFIKDDVIAYKKWKELIKEYKIAAENGIELLTSSDIGLLARYCKTFSEYERLLQRKNYEMELNEILALETAINKKMDMLIKMEDRLFLNPLAKVKNVPKKEPQKEKDPLAEKFGDI